MKRALVALITCCAMMLGAAGTAAAQPGIVDQATPEVVDVAEQVRDVDLDAAIAELEASSFPREVVVEGSMINTTYTLPSGLEYTVSKPQVSVMMNGGKNNYGVWIEFTPTEQRMIQAGAGAALAAGICAIPAVGVALCIVSSAVIAAAVVYISENGVCEPRLLIYPFGPERNRCSAV